MIRDFKFVAVVFLFVSFLSICKALFSSTELQALQDLYTYTNGKYWTWLTTGGEKWDFSAGVNTNPCNWQGLVCTADLSNTAEIHLHNYSLTGILPDCIGSFQYLTVLDLSSNFLKGSIPNQLGYDQRLIRLDLSNNLQLSGTIPLSIGNLLTVQYLNLSANMLTGSLPAQLTYCSLIKQLDLHSNLLQGTIPKEISELKNLTTLDLSSNQFTGPLPANMGGCTGVVSTSHLLKLNVQNNSLTGALPDKIFTNCLNLTHLQLANNSFDGTIPKHISTLTNLLYLELSMNWLTGTLPAEIGALTKLFVLDVSSNSLRCTIPTTLSALTHLYKFYLDYNEFNGTLPFQIFYDMNYLYALFVDHNRLSGTLPNSPTLFGKNTSALIALGLNVNFFNGTIPEAITSYHNLRYLDLDSTMFSGPIPQSIGNLTNLKELTLFDQNINGTIPESLYFCTKLETLLLYTNSLTGTVSSKLGNLVNLKLFYISGNYLRGKIPSSIQSLSSVQYFLLRDNMFTGPIPSEIGGMTNAGFIDLSSNKLTGTIPSTVTNLKKLIVLDLSINNLGNTIPDYLGSLGSLQWLSLHRNEIISTIPSALGSLSHLQFLDLRENQLTGSLPLSLGRLSDLQFFLVSNNQLQGNVSLVLNRLSNITFVNLSSNQFSESFSNFNFASTKLTVFVAANNQLRDAIGTAFRESTELQALNLANNSLTGAITSIPPLYSLNTVDLSDNQFTGTISSNFFESESLVSFSAVKNCLGGPLPIDTICKSTSLQTLALDGLFASEACQYLLFSIASNAYQAKLIDIGDLNKFKCIFNIPSLETLHLSGNGILGSIPEDLIVGPNLTDLTLSYNRLTGSIPSVITARSNWKVLDLSFNKINGSLNNNFATPSSHTNLVLRDNRISGAIPSSLLHADEINILEGNMFSCEPDDLVNPDSDKRSVPHADHHHHEYSCGSDFVNTNLLVWGAVVVGLVIVFRLLISLHWLTKWRALDKVSSIMAKVKGLLLGDTKPPENPKTIEKGKYNPGLEYVINQYFRVKHMFYIWYDSAMTIMFGPSSEKPLFNDRDLRDDMNLFKIIFHVAEYMKKLRDSCIELTLFAVTILLPLYVIIGRYNTHQYLYIWVVSIAFKSGIIPAIVCFSFLVIFYVYVFGNLNHYFSLPIVMNKYIEQLHRRFHRLYSYQTSQADEQRPPERGSITTFPMKSNEDMAARRVSGATMTAERLRNEFESYARLEKKNDSISSSGTAFWLLALLFPDVHKKEDQRHARLRGIFILFLCVVNFVVVIIVNYEYVEAHLKNYPFFADPLITFSVVVFKLCWADIVVTGIFSTLIDESYGKYQSHNSTEKLEYQFRKAKGVSKREELSKDEQDELKELCDRLEEKRYNIDCLQRIKLLTFLNILNDIIIPFFVFAVIDSNCFLYIFEDQEPVDVSYQRLVCGDFNWIGDFTVDRFAGYQFDGHQVCRSKEFFTATTSYNPPFVYSYQCASSLLNTFVSIILYEYFLPAIFFPVAGLVLNTVGTKNPVVKFVTSLGEMVHHVKHGARGFIGYLTRCVYNKPSPSTSHGHGHAHHSHHEQQHHEDKYKETIDEFVMSILTNMAVLMTFGFAFPLLALIVGVNVCITTIRYELIIHKCIKDTIKAAAESSTEHARYSLTDKTLDNRDNDELNVFTIERLQLIRASVPLILVISASFLSIFLFDILGDTIGFLQSLWILLLLPLLTYFMRIFNFFYRRYMKEVDNLYEELTTEDEDENDMSRLEARRASSKEAESMQAATLHQLSLDGGNEDFNGSNPLHTRTRASSAEMDEAEMDNEGGIHLKSFSKK